MEKQVRIAQEEVRKIELYINSGRKSMAEIVKETGADYAINGGLYDMTRFAANCHLRSKGYTWAEDKYNYFGLGWNSGDQAFSCVTALDKETVENYICCVELVHLGKKTSKLIMAEGTRDSRAKTVAGFYENGDTFLCCSSGGMSPEQMQEYVFSQGVYEAIMLDGGGSTQCSFRGDTMESSRRVHNLILVYTGTKEEPEKPETKGAFRIALGAGHGINSAGKRCLKRLDPNETREWWLNDRVCRYVAEELEAYEGWELLRTDDESGEVNIDLSERAKAANEWGADVYLSIHHNAGANGSAAGGIVVFSRPNGGKEAQELRDELYAALIENTGLKGNRWSGTIEYNYQILRETEMPAALLELGFMDSTIDTPIILTEEHARGCARAIASVLAQRGGLTKKPEAGKIYRVQLGAFRDKDRAGKLADELKKLGYEAFITQ